MSLLSLLLALSLRRLFSAQSPLVRPTLVLHGYVLCVHKLSALLPLLVFCFYTPNSPLFFYLLCVSSPSPPLSTLILVSLSHYESLSLSPSGRISLHSGTLVRVVAAWFSKYFCSSLVRCPLGAWFLTCLPLGCLLI